MVTQELRAGEVTIGPHIIRLHSGLRVDGTNAQVWWLIWTLIFVILGPSIEPLKAFPILQTCSLDPLHHLPSPTYLPPSYLPPPFTSGAHIPQTCSHPTGTSSAHMAKGSDAGPAGASPIPRAGAAPARVGAWAAGLSGDETEGLFGVKRNHLKDVTYNIPRDPFSYRTSGTVM